MNTQMFHLFRTGNARSRARLIATMLGGASFGFLAAGVVGWLIWGLGPRFPLFGALVGLLLVAMEPCPQCVKPHLAINFRRSFWIGYLLALWFLTIGVFAIIALLFVSVVLIPVLIAMATSMSYAYTLAGDMTLFWGSLSIRIVGGVLLTSVVSIAVLVAYTMLRRRVTT